MSGYAWKRKEWTTKGADPTVVVKWTQYDSAGNEMGSITELQDVYRGTGYFAPEDEAELKRMHTEQEDKYDREQRTQDEDLQWEIEHAERRAGWDPNP